MSSLFVNTRPWPSTIMRRRSNVFGGNARLVPSRTSSRFAPSNRYGPNSQQRCTGVAMGSKIACRRQAGSKYAYEAAPKTCSPRVYNIELPMRKGLKWEARSTRRCHHRSRDLHKQKRCSSDPLFASVSILFQILMISQQNIALHANGTEGNVKASESCRHKHI